VSTKYQLYVTERLNIAVASEMKNHQPVELLVSQVLKSQEEQHRKRTLNLVRDN